MNRQKEQKSRKRKSRKLERREGVSEREREVKEIGWVARAEQGVDETRTRVLNGYCLIGAL